jgi:hypothetical protein
VTLQNYHWQWYNVGSHLLVYVSGVIGLSLKANCDPILSGMVYGHLKQSQYATTSSQMGSIT